MTFTVEQLDEAIKRANESGAPQTDIALLWYYRARLEGGGLTPEELAGAMGVSVPRAGELIAMLEEHGHANRA